MTCAANAIVPTCRVRRRIVRLRKCWLAATPTVIGAAGSPYAIDAAIRDCAGCPRLTCLTKANGATPMNSRDQEHNGSTNQRGRARRVPRPAKQPERDPLGHALTDVVFDPLCNVTTFHYSMADFPLAHRPGRSDDQTNAKRNHRPRHHRGSVQPTCDRDANLSTCDERPRAPHLPVGRMRRSRP